MYALGLTWAEVNSGRRSSIQYLAQSFSAMHSLSWLRCLFLNMLPAGEPPCRPLVAALDAAAVSTLQRQTGAGG